MDCSRKKACININVIFLAITKGWGNSLCFGKSIGKSQNCNKKINCDMCFRFTLWDNIYIYIYSCYLMLFCLFYLSIQEHVYIVATLRLHLIFV